MLLGFPSGASDKEYACQWRRCKICGFDPWIGKIPWSKKCQPALVFLPGKSHGQKNLEGYSLWTVLERIVDGTAGKPQGQGLNPNSLQCSSDTDYLELIRSRCTG